MKLNDMRAAPALDAQDVSVNVLLEKYAKGDEAGIDDVRRRVARGLATAEAEPVRVQWEARFYHAMTRGFIPAGRVNSACGTDINATLINCFVQPVGDSVLGMVDGKPGIYDALREAAETMRRGGGVGYDFSAIRPKGAKVRGTHSLASEPVSYMRVFDRSCETVESAGARRGAQMGVMRIDHPDIEGFIRAKDLKGELNNFNVSVGVTDAFMRAMEREDDWQLVHGAQPDDATIAAGAHRREDGLWVYRTVRAHDLWRRVMESTYDHAEPGILFLDTINRDNNLYYIESIEATNPCGEQPLPSYGCCCLGSINLTEFITAPFGDYAQFDFPAFAEVVQIAVRALDNVLDITHWPLAQQKHEAMAKRRIGLGFTGLGDALVMLRLRYDTDEARAMAARIAQAMRDAAYDASVDLACEKGAFPRFDAARYLDGTNFASRLPEPIKARIREHGLRNSHLLSIAPTGTISLAFADNASNGIEPPFSWYYFRKKREPDGSTKEYEVADHAWRLYRAWGGDVNALPPYFVTALDMHALDHMRMLAAVQPHVDTSISKTVNVPADYPFDDFEDLYFEAWKAGLKGLATYRPNELLGAVLSTASATKTMPLDLNTSGDRRITLKELPHPVLGSLRWPNRPHFADGALGWCSPEIKHPLGSFAVFVTQDAEGKPFEAWVNGNEQPRGLGAAAKMLSIDMRCNDRVWLAHKLEALARASGDDAFTVRFPPDDAEVFMPSLVAAFARLVRYRCEQLGTFAGQEGNTPLVDAMFALKEPKTGTDGTMSWTVDVLNPATGDDFLVGLKELLMPDGTRRPYSMWLAGVYPRVLDGLCKLLSLDMRVIDPAWVGLKLKKLLNYGEPRGDFFAPVPGAQRQQVYPSTIAYLATLILHRYAMLGVLTPQGEPVRAMGVLETVGSENVTAAGGLRVQAGAICPDCGRAAVVKKDGCEFCTACGWTGACG